MKKALVGIVVLVAVAVVVPVGAMYIRPAWALSVLTKIETRRAQLHRVTLPTRDFEFRVLAGGSGPALVLLHGFSTEKEVWIRTAGSFTDRFSVLIPDLPGHGATKALGDPLYYDARVQAKRVKKLLNSLGIAPFYLAGHSMGGTIAATYAALFPEDVRALWLLSPGGVEGAEPSEFQRAFENGQNPLLVRNEADFAKQAQLLMSKPPFLPSPIRRAIAERVVARSEINADIFNDLLMRPVAVDQVLKGFSAPVLITWGSEDRAVHPSGAEILKKVMPQAVVNIQEGIGHAPMVEAPEETAELFLAFVDGLGGQR